MASFTIDDGIRSRQLKRLIPVAIGASLTSNGERVLEEKETLRLATLNKKLENKKLVIYGVFIAQFLAERWRKVNITETSRNSLIHGIHYQGL